MTYLSKNINLFIKAIFTTLLLAVVVNLNASDLYKTNIDLNLRSGPNKTYNSILIIKNGETVEVIDKSNTTWFKIKYNGKTGYLFSEYLIPIIVEKPRVEERPKPIQEEDNSGSIFLIIIFVLSAIVLIIHLSTRKKKSIISKSTFINQSNKTEKEQEHKEKLVENIIKNIKIEVTTSNSNSNYKDNSIIDITGDTVISNSANLLKKYISGVPYWSHQYVYSYSEIKSASNEQKQFYVHFKNSFINGIYYDLEGNTNYAFILLFNLLDEFETHKDIGLLEKQLKNLGQNYSKTKSYCVSFLIEKMEARGDSEGVSRLRTQDKYEYQNNYTDYDYWKLGSKYKAKLKLNDEEVKLLNKLWFPSNNFCSIEFCCIQIIKLYLAAISSLNKKFIEQGTSLDFQLTQIADVIARKQHNYHTGSNNYKYL